MVDSWLESFVESYYQSFKGYLVQKNVWFSLEKKEGVRKQGGWSDIDILVVSDEELILVNCKTFLGTKKAEETANDIVLWFEEASEFIIKHHIYSNLLTKRKFPLIKQLILEIPHKSAESTIKKIEPSINIIYYKDMLIEWIDHLKTEMLSISSKNNYLTPSDKLYKKTEDIIERLLMELVRYNLL